MLGEYVGKLSKCSKEMVQHIRRDVNMIKENHYINKFNYEDDDQFGEIDASQQFGQPPLQCTGCFLTTATRDTLRLTTTLLAHYLSVWQC